MCDSGRSFSSMCSGICAEKGQQWDGIPVWYAGNVFKNTVVEQRSKYEMRNGSKVSLLMSVMSTCPVKSCLQL